MSDNTVLKKPLMIAILGGFLFSFLYSWLVHGMMLLDVYQQTPIFRPMGEPNEYCWYGLGGMFFMAAFAALIFSKGYKGHGLIEGVRFGLYLGSFISAFYISMYSWLPVPFEIITAWVGATYIEYIGMGMIFALVYKNSSKLK